MLAYTLLVPLLAVAILALVLRWASNLDTDKAHHKDYGLLREVAKVPSSTAARVVEQRLYAVGVRATKTGSLAMAEAPGFEPGMGFRPKPH